MYWSDWDEKSPKIEKAYLDGTNRTLLMKFEPKKHWPNGLALDSDRQNLYYADAKADEICRINITSRQKKCFLSQEVHHIFGLTILGQFCVGKFLCTSSFFAKNVYKSKL